MLGVEHFKEQEDRAFEYFEIKLKNIFTNPGILKSNESTREQTKQNTPQTHPKINVNPIQNYSILNKPLTSKKPPENNILSFSFQEPPVTRADKFFMCAPPPNINNNSQFIGKSQNHNKSESSDSGDVNQDEEISEKKNSVKEEKIQYIEEQVQEDRFILQEQAKAMAQQSKKQEKRISQVNYHLIQQIEAVLHGQESIIQKRQELRKLRSQFSMHNLNKTQSTPIMKSTDQYKTPQQNAICIPEEAGEIGSSNLPSNKKVEISQFTFKEESQ